MDVLNLKEADAVAKFGAKAANLAKLIQADLPVPEGIVVGLDGFSSNGLTDSAKHKVLEYASNSVRYAVRSSSLSEDAEDASWAGQFETYLNVEQADLIEKIEACHKAVELRAKAYAMHTSKNDIFKIAVIVQKMIEPNYAGVLFTQDPVSGSNNFVIEYVNGLAEKLVSGTVNPKKVSISETESPNVPFNLKKLSELARQIEHIFGKAQDIEWASKGQKIWLIQARPITTKPYQAKGHYLGEPNELFYWGPSRGTPLYMGDFMIAAEKFFMSSFAEPTMPNPPKTLVLFYEGKVVWLINEQAFADFTKACFKKYLEQKRFERDYKAWHSSQKDSYNALFDAWEHTLFAEFSLYGAREVVNRLLERLDVKERQTIWAVFTNPDSPTFLSRIDEELIRTEDPKAMAKKYPWIADGYDGLGSAEKYFTRRLTQLIDDNSVEQSYLEDTEKKRRELIQKNSLTEQEVEALNLTRKIAEFMDERKAWMMQTRKLIKKPLTKIQYGWVYQDGKATVIDAQDSEQLWQRYINFKSSSETLGGIVASTGNKHFISGEVAIALGPTDPVGKDKILVVPATSPTYVPMMRNARALVTDHGGMMSHAAIVAREFNLPCIVGTKQATKQLKNGDKVVLDLLKGKIIH